MDTDKILLHVENAWQDSICAALSEYIRIPNQSPTFDQEIFTNGYQEAALKVLVDWIKSQNVEGLKLEVLQPKDKTPLIFFEVAATGPSEETVLMYGHMDKQPPMTKDWEEGLGPHEPIIKDGKLYGRGGADDGYSTFAAITAIKALHEQKIPHARIVTIIEACEESGSRDLPDYIALKAEAIGTPSLIICLDSGCGNYDQLWLTTSLRGMLAGDLRVQVLKEGVHSGTASGVVPSSFRIMRSILDRLEDSRTGKVLLKQAWAEIPKQDLEAAKRTAEVLGDHVLEFFPWLPGVKPMDERIPELLLNRTWRPTISYTGADGFPPCANAGNVLRPQTTLKLSVRLPPSVEPEPVVEELRSLISHDVPYGAHVSFHSDKAAAGWSAPSLAPWLEAAVQSASLTYFGKPAMYEGEGGSIPFMGMLGKRFPKAQFLVTGLLGPGSNAHGPNEFLHIGCFKRVTASVASVLSAHAVAHPDKDEHVAKHQRV